ncbi:hypothetical protein H5410_012070 [Solanum commersonii]|uniref:Uncharacterized protein n=1 Tax=Solanum commersonii TaxID=4109 RepID=A0A9J6AR61_SOLCO|nr:hypothetical protein H5410_012070 [Solanum commersonii]
MNWWLSRSINNALQKNVEYRGTHEISYQNVGLIIGVTGVVGNSLAGTLSSTDTPGGPWKVYGVSRRGTPVCSIAKVTYIQCDVSKATDVQAKLSTLKDVTHIFWVTLAFDLSTAKSCEINGPMFRNVLTCVIPNAPNLRPTSVSRRGGCIIWEFTNQLMGNFMLLLMICLSTRT